MTRGERRTKYIYGGRENFGKIFLPQWLWGEISVLFISSWNACRPEIDERVLVNNAINIANIGVCCSRWWNWVEGRSVDFLSIAPFCRLPPIIINRLLQRISWILMKHRNPVSLLTSISLGIYGEKHAQYLRNFPFFLFEKITRVIDDTCVNDFKFCLQLC